mmetsp:Transcript_93169/g.272682  ORF Transcript_93169/g.272682 Transcript_93169/m.272682 type:complete len:321 (+) Transcript_93169:532-1494(+)
MQFQLMHQDLHEAQLITKTHGEKIPQRMDCHAGGVLIWKLPKELAASDCIIPNTYGRVFAASGDNDGSLHSKVEAGYGPRMKPTCDNGTWGLFATRLTHGLQRDVQDVGIFKAHQNPELTLTRDINTAYVGVAAACLDGCDVLKFLGHAVLPAWSLPNSHGPLAAAKHDAVREASHAEWRRAPERSLEGRLDGAHQAERRQARRPALLLRCLTVCICLLSHAADYVQRSFRRAQGKGPVGGLQPRMICEECRHVTEALGLAKRHKLTSASGHGRIPVLFGLAVTHQPPDLHKAGAGGRDHAAVQGRKRKAVCNTHELALA